MTFNIQVKEINDVYKLVNILIGFDGYVDLESGRYKVDGKSILGIFSLDLRQPIKLTYDSEKDADKLYEQLKPFIVD
ncbi:MAG: HPr family phosphocarrier protein [Ruminococcaceae bacterium]|nr:HPr family phosphocarrier protein [Oscillospiraceae bacterium]